MTISKKMIVVGFIGLAVLNPLAANLGADALITAINIGLEYLVLASGYIMVVAGTLIAVGALLVYTESKQANDAKLKGMKNKRTAKAGKLLEV